MNSVTSSTDESAKTTAELNIDGISEPVVLRYFETLNAGDFQATADLFAPDGAMCPPFESDIVGHEAIAQYLEAEAKGMQLQPLSGISEQLDDENIEYKIAGKVQTPLFGVNVSWTLVLNPQSEILMAKIKLLAALKDLMNIKDDKGGTKVKDE